ncbi:hypothetical protein P3S68_025531 [Capsicum galapagoense]
MALKVVMMLFLAMIVVTEHYAMAQEKIDIACYLKCVLKCEEDPLCLGWCLSGCIYHGNTDESVDTVAATRKRVCDFGCTLGHCSKFLIQYDKEKFGSCMTSCSEKYCIDNALEKAS